MLIVSVKGQFHEYVATSQDSSGKIAADIGVTQTTICSWIEANANR